MQVKMRFIFVPALLAACAAPMTIITDAPYKDLGKLKRVVVASPAKTDEACYRDDGLEDDGTSERFRNVDVVAFTYPNGRTETYPIRLHNDACWDPSTGTIWLSETATLPMFFHELCHAGMGLDEKTCLRLFPGR